MTSYEELTPESKEQVDAFMDNMEDHGWVSDIYQRVNIKEHVSNLVQSCIYQTKKQDNRAVILTSREWKSLSRAYLNLYTLITGGPAYLGDYFPDRQQEYRDIAQWGERFDEEKPINKRRRQ